MDLPRDVDYNPIITSGIPNIFSEWNEMEFLFIPPENKREEITLTTEAENQVEEAILVRLERMKAFSST